MQRCAIYARYSTDEQRATSIDDQVRRCRALAEQHGFEIQERMIFSDEAVTGTSKGISKRDGYRRLLDAIDARECDVVVTDEVSRLTRSVTEGGRLMESVDAVGIRFVTADGIDTEREGWKLLWLMKLTTATHEIDATAHRTRRGMLGQLERGYQIAQTPFGYAPVKDVTPGGRVLGTHWLIDETAAGIVRQMYRWRVQGQSAAQIAKRLNALGVLPPGSSRAKTTPYWRPASVLRVLANTVYRGVFVWNGSDVTKHKAKKRRKAVESVAFSREQLRLVTDDIWHAANPTFATACTRSYRPRGGGKYLLSGLVRCGDCDALCTPSYGTKGGTLHCPQCEVAYRTGGREGWVGYSSVAAAREALRWMLYRVFSPGPVRNAFHSRLAARLQASPDAEIERLKREHGEVERRLERIKQLMLNLDNCPDAFASEFNATTAARDAIASRIGQLQREAKLLDERTVAAQCNVDVTSLIDRLLDETNGVVEPYQAKATLRRLLSRFQLVARPRRGMSIFAIAVRPGVLLSEATETAVIDDVDVAFEVTVMTTAHRPVQWSVHGVAITVP
jgi:DNA invertase Pin-like site-specific DNA recombinase